MIKLAFDCIQRKREETDYGESVWGNQRCVLRYSDEKGGDGYGESV